jgi:hypothetical protein
MGCNLSIQHTEVMTSKLNKLLFLSNVIINPKYISHINVKPNVYEIVMACPDIDGSFLFASGGFQTTFKDITIDSNKSPTDYDAIKKWLNACESEN